MQIITWNVNGIRAIIRKGFHEFLKKEKPDVLCLQEIKISSSARDKDKEKHNIDFPDYEEVWNCAERPGYSGTAILVKEGLAFKELPKLSWDNEGRIQAIDLGEFYVANVYFPNANHELTRLKFKLDFNDKLLKYLNQLKSKKPVIIVGDYNVAHEEIDLARPKDNVGSPGFTDEERAWMTNFLQAGYVDIFRKMWKDKVQYTWWSFRFHARAKNIGWRIDYICCSKNLFKKIKHIQIKDKVMGSDHCPVEINL